MSSDPPPPSTRERLRSFTTEVLNALSEAEKNDARTSAQVSALRAEVARLGQRQGAYTLALAVLAIIAQLVDRNLWRVGYKPRAPVPVICSAAPAERTP